MLLELVEGGATHCSADDVPPNLACALPTLATLCSEHFWGDMSAGVLPFTEPQRIAPPLYLQNYLSEMPIRALAAVILLADFLEIERVRNVCIYVLVKRRGGKP